MFLKDPVKDVDTVYYNLSKPLMAVIGMATLATITAIFYVQPLISYLYYMVSARADIKTKRAALGLNAERQKRYTVEDLFKQSSHCYNNNSFSNISTEPFMTSVN